MAEENGRGGGINTEVSTSNSSMMEIEKVPNETDSKQETDTNNKKEESTQTVPIYQLFSFADSLDYLLMFVGAIAAAGNGASMPLMTILFGDLINSFGNESNSKDMVHVVSKVSSLSHN